MSGAVSWGIAAVAAAAASAGANAYQQKRAGDRADAQGRRQAEAAEKARLQQEQDFNKANRKQADIGGLLQVNTPVGGGMGLTGGTYTPGDLGGGGMLGR